MNDNFEAKNPLDFMFGYTADASRTELENRILKETIHQLQGELSKYRKPALMVCDVVDLIEGHAIVKTPNGNKFYVEVSSDCEDIKPGDSVLTEQKNLTIVKKITTNKKFNVEKFVIIEKPDIAWQHIGGLDQQIQEVREVIELPLKNPELFEKVGICPPKGILFHGPPGTGKTLLAKAVASSTNSTFIEVVGSELVQKYIGEGAKLISEIFQLAREKAPSIIFIDELDALAARRVDVGTSGEREVQRTFMQLLSELDGFKPLGNVKLIGCTNRKDILDPAVIRPGRLDRLIEVPLPNKEGLKDIFVIHSQRMNFSSVLDFDKLLAKIQGFSGAEVKALCTEAGYFAIRNKRTEVSEEDLYNAVEKLKEKEEGDQQFTEMFG